MANQLKSQLFAPDVDYMLIIHILLGDSLEYFLYFCILKRK